MTTNRFWLTLVLLICAPLAQAGWRPCPGATSDTGTATATAVRGRSQCYRTATATDTPRLNGEACTGGLDFLFNSDIAAVTITATAYPYICVATGAVGVFTDCEKVMVDRTGDGINDDLPMNGSPASAQSGTYNLSPSWYSFDIGNGGLTTLELTVVCK